uniref:Putative secreted protein n=1 Tax=Ixodes ricinus TaxID=34613 RepID=A0A6B0TV44_IXORI
MTIVLLGFSAPSALRSTFCIFPQPDTTHSPLPTVIASHWTRSPTALPALPAKSLLQSIDVFTSVLKCTLPAPDA